MVEFNPFLSTPSARRATFPPLSQTGGESNFYPRPPRGGRRPRCLPQATAFIFLSTPSARRATDTCGAGGHIGRNFYPRPPRGGRRSSCTAWPLWCSYFYPRPPRGGRPLSRFAIPLTRKFLSTPSARRATWFNIPYATTYLFLSTPSARRATSPLCSRRFRSKDFYPRPPRGGRQQKQRQNLYFQTNYTTFCTNLEEP